MRLFGEQGYAATTVAQVEAGLIPGAGGLYAHFPSKEAMRRAALEAIRQPDPGMATTLSHSHGGNPTSSSTHDLATQLEQS